MTDQEMERYLASRAQAMPVPPPDFSRLRERVLAQEKTGGRKRRHPLRRVVIACAAAAAITLTVAVGYSSYQRYLASEYGAYPFRTTNIAVCWEFGVNLPLHLEDYDLIRNDIHLIADTDAGRESARTHHIYRVGSALYADGSQSDDRTEVMVGSTKQPYWSTYFSYDPETLEWLPEKAEQYGYVCENTETMRYGGFAVHLYDLWHDGQLVTYTATWVDEEAEVCWHVTDNISREHLITMVQALIDCNS